jgi:predicted ATPase
MKALNSSEQLSRIVLKGFKSIAECDIELGALNILIGANGAGKSNFISFFRMIQHLLDSNLQTYVGKQGSPEALLHYGRKKTEQIKSELYFGNNGYWCTLEPTADNRMMFADESFWWNSTGERSIGKGHFETNAHKGTHTGIDQFVLPAMKQWRVYQFHDTSETSKMKQIQGINDNEYLRPDGSNLAAFLYLLKKRHPKRYDRIVKTIQLAAPFFRDFHLRPTPENKEYIELEWNDRDSDIPFKAFQLSDGTLRFICLTTVLLQPPDNQPETILIDEPELGLHPLAITLLAALMKSASYKKQIIVSTQSVELLEEFDPEDVVVVDRKAGKSILKRLNLKELEIWLEDYSLGELWKKNILGGRPSR